MDLSESFRSLLFFRSKEVTMSLMLSDSLDPNVGGMANFSFPTLDFLPSAPPYPKIS